MMAIKAPAAAEELLGESAMAKVMKARAERRMEAAFLAIAAGSNGEPRRWYALRTDNRSEIAVEKCLADAGVTAWVPRHQRVVVCRKSHKRRVKVEVTFGGYVFVRVVPDARSWVGLTRVKGVAGIVAADGVPFPIADKEMSDLIDLVDAGWFDVKEVDGHIAAGTKVRIEAGAFAGFEAVMDGYVGKRSVRVLAHILGKDVPVTLPLAKVAKSD